MRRDCGVFSDHIKRIESYCNFDFYNLCCWLLFFLELLLNVFFEFEQVTLLIDLRAEFNARLVLRSCQGPSVYLDAAVATLTSVIVARPSL